MTQIAPKLLAVLTTTLFAVACSNNYQAKNFQAQGSKTIGSSSEGSENIDDTQSSDDTTNDDTSNPSNETNDDNGSTNPDPKVDETIETANLEIDVNKSILITDRNVLESLSHQIDMGYLLGQVGKMENELGEKGRTAGRWVAQVFQLGRQDQERYVSHVKELGKETMGAIPNADRFLDRALEIWTDNNCNMIHKNDPNFKALKQIDDPELLKSKTFRLLAVVNRIDNAGEYDDRITNANTETPRFLGEVHLVFGLIDRSAEYENIECGKETESNGKAYPATYVLSYTLPVIQQNQSENYNSKNLSLDTDTSLFKLGYKTKLWEQKIKLWAAAWSELSKYNKDEKLAENLGNLLSLAIRPENFLSIKTNTKVTQDEFELREWYVFASGSVRRVANSNGLLIPRRLRREPYACMNGSKTITALVNHYWNKSDNDLDMVTREYDLDGKNEQAPDSGRGYLYDETRSGYALLRDQTRPLMRSIELDVLRSNDTNYYWATGGACGQNFNEMPQAMLSGPLRNEEPQFIKDDIVDENGDVVQEADTLMILPPFARIKNKGEIWKLKSDELDAHKDGTITSDATKESMRHAFAIRTCTGCHSQEGATKGFHIFPRLEKEESALSPFLTGKAGNRFTYNDKVYEYAKMNERKQYLKNFIKGKQSLYDSLKLPERFH